MVWWVCSSNEVFKQYIDCIFIKLSVSILDSIDFDTILINVIVSLNQVIVPQIQRHQEYLLQKTDNFISLKCKLCSCQVALVEP